MMKKPDYKKENKEKNGIIKSYLYKKFYKEILLEKEEEEEMI